MSFFYSMPRGNFQTTINNSPSDWDNIKITEFSSSFFENENKFKVKNVIFHNPATIVFWADGSKTVVKCGKGDCYDAEKGLALCYMKKALGNKGNFNEVLKEHLEEEYERT